MVPEGGIRIYIHRLQWKFRIPVPAFAILQIALLAWVRIHGS